MPGPGDSKHSEEIVRNPRIPVIVLLYTYGRLEYVLFAVRDGEGEWYAFQRFFFRNESRI
jgi:hypothetical protein